MTRISTDPFSRGLTFGIETPKRVRRDTQVDLSAGLFTAPSVGVDLSISAPTIKEVEQPGFEFVFGFIPTVNFGNIFGIENDIARIALNILLDPINIGLAFFTGGLSTAGKVASATKALNQSRGILKIVRGATATERVNKAQSALQTLARFESNPLAKDALIAASNAGDELAFIKAARQLRKAPISDKIAKVIPSKTDLLKLDDLIRAEGSAIKQGLDLATLPRVLQATRVEQVEAGQRALIQFRIPGSGIQKTIAEGKPLFAALDRIFPASPLLSDTTRKVAKGLGTESETLREMLKGMFFVRGARMGEAALGAERTKAGFIAKMNELASGSADEGLGTLLTFFREGRGIPLEAIEKVGLSAEVTRLGIKVRDGKDAFQFLDRLEFDKFLKEKGWFEAATTLNKDLGTHLDSFFNMMKSTGVADDLPYIENYITHFWDVAPNTAKKIAGDWSRKGVFLNKRKFANALVGMNKGFTLKFDNAFDVMEQYELVYNKLIQNKQILNTLADPKSTLIINNLEVPIFATLQTVKKFGLQGEYVELTDPRILRLMGKKRSNWVPSQLAKDLKVIYDKPFDNIAARFGDRFNAIAKGFSLSSSLFHSFSLTESAIAVLGPVKGFVTAAKLGFGIPGLSQAMLKSGIAKRFPAIADDMTNKAISAGLQIKVPSDVQMNVVQQVLGKTEALATKAIPGFGGVLGKLPRKYFDMFNTSLWDNYHHPLKLIAFDDVLKRLGKANPTARLSNLEREAAEFVNDAFGGQNWERLLVHPKFKQAMHWALLAPDWTISNLRIAGVGTSGVSGTVRGILGKGRNGREQLVGAYWRTALPVYFGMFSVANRAMSGHWPWDNAPGHKLDVETGDVDEKGRKQYIKFGKQFREPFRWLTEPQKIFAAKLSPGVQVLTEQLTAHTTTGFPTEFAAERQAVPLTIMEEVPFRARAFVGKFVPFSFRGNNWMLAFPKSTFNNRDAIRGISDAIKSGDGKSVTEILKLAEVNGLSVPFIKAQVKKGTGDPRGLMNRPTTEGLLVR